MLCELLKRDNLIDIISIMTGSRFTPGYIFNQTKFNQGILISEQSSFSNPHLLTKGIYPFLPNTND